MSTTIIGFGYKARRGKDTACNAILEARDVYGSVRKYAFADALREEIESAMFDQWIQDGPKMWAYSPLLGIQHLCAWAGVPYDPTAVPDAVYPYGKQRALTQWWGTEYRRAQDPNYWVKRLAERIAAEAPPVAIISDLRFHNEYEFIQLNGGYCVRVDRPGFEIADGKHHISETLLDSLADDAWDHILVNSGDVENLQQDAVDFFDEVTR